MMSAAARAPDFGLAVAMAETAGRRFTSATSEPRSACLSIRRQAARRRGLRGERKWQMEMRNR